MSRIAKDLAALATMSPAQLKERWVEIEGPASPALPPPLVRRLLAQRLQERKFGGLSATVVRELERAGRGEIAPSQRQAIRRPVATEMPAIAAAVVWGRVMRAVM